MTYVFDLDGTLIDSRKRHWMLMDKLLRQHGIKVPDSFQTSFLSYKADGHTGLDYLTLKMNIPNNIAEKIQTEWIVHIEDEELQKHDVLFPDVISTLSMINDRILLVTLRNNENNLRRSLKKLRLEKYNTIVLKHGSSKTSVLRTIKDDLIMIGDTETDYEAAVEAQCRYYILNRGFRSELFWKKRNVRSYSGLDELWFQVQKNVDSIS